MPKFAEDIQLLYLAVNAPLGIVVGTNNVTSAISRLYAARKEAADPSLARLQVRRSPEKPEEEIWIVKGQENASK